MRTWTKVGSIHHMPLTVFSVSHALSQLILTTPFQGWRVPQKTTQPPTVGLTLNSWRHISNRCSTLPNNPVPSLVSSLSHSPGLHHKSLLQVLMSVLLSSAVFTHSQWRPSQTLPLPLPAGTHSLRVPSSYSKICILAHFKAKYPPALWLLRYSQVFKDLPVQCSPHVYVSISMSSVPLTYKHIVFSYLKKIPLDLKALTPLKLFLLK